MSKDKFDVNFVDANGEENFLKVSNTLSGVSGFLETLAKDSVLVAEDTGTYGDLLVFLSNQMNIRIALVPGYTLKHSMGNPRGKSDPIDASRIREYGMRFFDRLVFREYDTENLCELQELYRLRFQLVKSRKEVMTGDKSRSKKPIQSLNAHRSVKRILQSLSEEIDTIELEMNRIILVSPELSESFKLITSVTGIGKVIAIDLIIKTGNFRQIDTARRAASYAGICPFPNSSGNMVRKSRISPYGDKSLKTLLYMGTLSVVKHNKEYNLYYQKKRYEGKPHFLIMNNISNKLIQVVYALIRDGKPFDKMHVCLDPREKIEQLQ